MLFTHSPFIVNFIISAVNYMFVFFTILFIVSIYVICKGEYPTEPHRRFNWIEITYQILLYDLWRVKMNFYYCLRP